MTKKVMPDGTVCHKGPTCKRHSAQNSINRFFAKSTKKAPIKTLMHKHLFASSVPAAEYDKFHAETIRMMDAITTFLSKDDEVVKFSDSHNYSALNGRNGASVGEGYIKSIIKKHKAAIIKEANVKGSSYKLVDIIDFVETSTTDNDSSARTYADIAIVFKTDSGITSAAPVNIKFTNGGTADNIGGWNAFEYMITGSTSGNCNETNLMGRIDYDTLKNSTVASDYFIMSFRKDPALKKLFVAASNFSLLQFLPSNFTYNRSQSFPFQANSAKLSAAPALQKTSLFERRSTWVNYLNAKDDEFFAKRQAEVIARKKRMEVPKTP